MLPGVICMIRGILNFLSASNYLILKSKTVREIQKNDKRETTKRKKEDRNIATFICFNTQVRYFRKMYSPVHENRSLRCFQNQDLRSIKEIFQRYTKANETPF